MSGSVVLSALRDKRGRVAGEILAAERRITELRTALVHLDATLKLFAGEEINPEAIPPRLPRPAPVNSSGFQPRGDLTRMVLDTLRRAEGGLSTAEVVQAMIDAYDVPETDSLGRRRLRDRVEGSLYRQKDRAILTHYRDGQNTVWRVAED